ncbi:MAG: hypothetical protein EA427_05370 [Spirochaetaceae bacterium]|nr:MAG: hypothetical protein EA427_05370 [Spirochaetaceae bacterium]
MRCATPKISFFRSRIGIIFAIMVVMGDPAFNEDGQVEGISEEDQREIMLEIEKVAGENRIALSEGLFDFKARKNGALFPLLVNLVGVALLVGGIASLLWLFRTGEQEMLEGGRAVVTAESRLIEEIRRETEAQLAEKDGEIASIQSLLQEIDAERRALVGNLQEQLAQREAELRRELDVELEAERQRLRALNLSEEEIEMRLASFAEVKEREFSQRLDQFARQAQAEQERLAQELNEREAEFNRSLTQASQEREELMRESAERLSALQAEFEAELAAGQAELDEAQAALSRLSREQEREGLLRGQIRGLYQTATVALQQGNHDLARARMRDLRNLLNEESTLRVPGIREQRPVDLLLIDSLESLIRFDQQFGTEEAERRLSQGTLVARVQDLVDRASTAAQEGQTDEAVSLYRQALEVIPAVSESYGFLGDADDQTTAVELTRINEEAAQLLQQADAARVAGNYQVAMTGYSDLLRDYSRSRYRLDAVTGMQETLSTIQTRNLALQDSLTDTIAELEADRETLRQELEETEENLAAARQEVNQRQERITQLQASVSTLQAQAPLAAANISTLQTDLTRSQEQLTASQNRVRQLEQRVAERDAALEEKEEELLTVLNDLANAQARIGSVISPEVQAELDRLSRIEDELRRVRSEWERYRQESGVAGASLEALDSLELLEARMSLVRFLQETTMADYFPRMSDEIELFDSAFIASGRENALLDAADLLLDLSFAESTSERLALIRSARSGAEPAFQEFLSELESVIRSTE